MPSASSSCSGPYRKGVTQPVVVAISQLPTSSSAVAALVDRLWVLGTTGVEERTDELIAGFDSLAAADAAIAALPTDLACSVGEVAPLSSWQTFAEVTVEGRFVIRPPWLEAPVDQPVDAIELVIDPGATFGHGGHPSTRLALRALADHVRPGDTVLDVGCGSGVLAIAAARLGTTVKTFDIDPAATACTLANAETNRTTIDASTMEIAALDPTNSWDVVIANMPRPLLVEHAEALLTATGRTLIIAGMLDDQIVATLRGDRITHDGWGCDIIDRTAL